MFAGMPASFRVTDVKVGDAEFAGVVWATALVFGVDMSDIMGRSRLERISDARQAAMYWCYNMHLQSYYHVGKYFDREHATIMHGVKRAKNLMQTDKEFRRKMDNIRQLL